MSAITFRARQLGPARLDSTRWTCACFLMAPLAGRLIGPMSDVERQTELRWWRGITAAVAATAAPARHLFARRQQFRRTRGAPRHGHTGRAPRRLPNNLIINSVAGQLGRAQGRRPPFAETPPYPSSRLPGARRRCAATPPRTGRARPTIGRRPVRATSGELPPSGQMRASPPPPSTDRPGWGTALCVKPGSARPGGLGT
jgi:hypothetical protein